jgi:hypothetical protein
MKKIFTLLLISISQVFAQTNVYHPFPESNARWNIHLQSGCDFSFSGMNQYYTLRIEGDTIINTNTYHLLKIPTKKIINSTNCMNPGTFYTPQVSIGAIRQDTAARKVFIVPSGNNTEQLLYDFNMQVGDTLHSFLSNNQDTVVSIDSILVGSSYRKRWLVNACYQIYIIEGIGSSYGVVKLFSGCITDGPTIDITCFTHNGITEYPVNADSCETILDLPITNSESKSFEIYIEQSTLHISTNRATQAFQIIDYYGRIIKEFEAGGTTYMLNLENKPGAYIVKSIDKYGHTEVRRCLIF